MGDGENMDSNEEYATSGLLYTIFQSPEARVLDQIRILGNMEQTISMLAESTNLSYKTVQLAVKRLLKLGFMQATRKIGNAQAYQFEIENHSSDLLEFVEKFELKQLKKK